MKGNEVKSAFLGASNKLYVACSYIRNHQLRYALRSLIHLKAALLAIWTFFTDYSGFGAIWVKTAGVVIEVLIIMSPVAAYPYIIMKPQPICYLFYVLWIVSWIGLTVLVAAMEYIRSYRRDI